MRLLAGLTFDILRDTRTRHGAFEMAGGQTVGSGLEFPNPGGEGRMRHADVGRWSADVGSRDTDAPRDIVS